MPPHAKSGGSKQSDLPQFDKFVESARDLECDEDEARFEETVKRVAKAPKAEPEDDA
jgi:hypothetical protein